MRNTTCHNSLHIYKVEKGKGKFANVYEKFKRVKKTTIAQVLINQLASGKSIDQHACIQYSVLVILGRADSIQLRSLASF